MVFFLTHPFIPVWFPYLTWLHRPQPTGTYGTQYFDRMRCILKIRVVHMHVSYISIEDLGHIWAKSKLKLEHFSRPGKLGQHLVSKI